MKMFRSALAIFGLLLSLGGVQARARPLDPDAIGAAAGAKPTVAPDGVVKLSWPRDEVSVTIDGVGMKPFAGLGSWAAFVAAGSDAAMMMGDTVLFQDEVNPAIDAAFAAGLEVTALHNHFFYDEPKVLFMHIGGHGAPTSLATSVKAVWDAIKAVRKANPIPAQGFGGPAVLSGSITSGPLEQIFGTKPDVKDGSVKFTIGRNATMHGVKVGGSMGLTTWAAFTGTDSAAAVDGDFMMSAAEITPVLKALRASHINIVALHNHMIGETPAVFFTHFWGKGPAFDLAKAIGTALPAQKAAGKVTK